MNEGNGWMATILREPGFIYNVRYDKVPLQKVALSERVFPEKWIAPSRVDVTDEFLSYVRPLIGEDWVSVPMVNGVQRFTRFKPMFAEKCLPEYTPKLILRSNLPGAQPPGHSLTIQDHHYVRPQTNID